MNSKEKFTQFTLNPENKNKIFVRPVFSKALRSKSRVNKNQKLAKVSEILNDTDKLISDFKIQQIVEIIKE